MKSLVLMNEVAPSNERGLISVAPYRHVRCNRLTALKWVAPLVNRRIAFVDLTSYECKTGIQKATHLYGGVLPSQPAK